MKTTICDICYWQSKEGNEKLTQIRYTSSIKQGAMKFKVDVCQDHKDWIKQQGKKSVQELNEILTEMQNLFWGI